MTALNGTACSVIETNLAYVQYNVAYVVYVVVCTSGRDRQIIKPHSEKFVVEGLDNQSQDFNTHTTSLSTKLPLSILLNKHLVCGPNQILFQLTFMLVIRYTPHVAVRCFLPP